MWNGFTWKLKIMMLCFFLFDLILSFLSSIIWTESKVNRNVCDSLLLQSCYYIFYIFIYHIYILFISYYILPKSFFHTWLYVIDSKREFRNIGKVFLITNIFQNVIFINTLFSLHNIILILIRSIRRKFFNLKCKKNL